jgi:subtilisin family serine protease
MLKTHPVQKILGVILLTLVVLTLALSPLPAQSQGEVVGVRIFTETNSNLTIFDDPDIQVIDYGSFKWALIPRTELARLEAVGADYQQIEEPYTLTLGGQSFDPLFEKPSFGRGWDETKATRDPNLHLVQFHGPTKPEWLGALEENGLEVLQYIHPFTYVVWGNTLSLEKSRGNSFVRWDGDYRPGYAVQPANRTLNSDALLVRIMTYPAATPLVQQDLQSMGESILGTSVGVDPVFDITLAKMRGDLISSIASLPGVYTIQPVPTDGGDRGEMSNQVNAGNTNSINRAFRGYLTWLNSLGLSGEGVIIANVDSGIDQSHPDLVNRILPCVGESCGGDQASNHGTHTAGIMAGDASSGARDAYGFLRGLGMAPDAYLVEQVYNPIYKQENGMLTLMAESARNQAVISGNSWGPSGSPLGYDLDTRLVDIGVRDADPEAPGNQQLSYILSIMNGFGGTSSQGTPDEAKNIFSVGSTFMQNFDGSQNLNINNLSSNSAHGPALDGRNLPHMVAPGCYVDSTITSSGYGLMCGTSMASPNVSGAAALFFQRYRRLFGTDPSPAMVKAAFLPVAHDLAGFRDADGAILGHPFDSKQGWGRLDAANVLDPPGGVYYYDQPVTLNSSGETWIVELALPEPINGLSAMLVWTDSPGHGLGGSSPAWVNDLNLSISVNGQMFYGNNFGGDGLSAPGGSPDFMNNTEGIFLPASEAATYTLQVTAANIAGDGVPNYGDETDQDFALVVYILPAVKLDYQYILPLFYR